VATSTIVFIGTTSVCGGDQCSFMVRALHLEGM
jgi:hypothetical protein